MASSSPFSEAELEVAAVLQCLPLLVLRDRLHLRWGCKKSRTRPPVHKPPDGDKDDNPTSSSPVSPLFFYESSSHRKSRVKQQARAVARLRQTNRNLQREAESARAKFRELLAENSRLKKLRSSRRPQPSMETPGLWSLQRIYGCDASKPLDLRPCRVESLAERRTATAEARRRRIEIKRRRLAERKAATMAAALPP